jgi:selenocysteine lyase/cysteine desulfurase
MLAGFAAAVDYLASLGWGGDRRGALEAAFREITAYEASLGERFLTGLPDRVRVVGISSPDGRVPTFSIEVDGLMAAEVAKGLADRRVAAWAGHYYAVEPMERLGYLDGGGLTRIGFLHLNTLTEVDAVLAALSNIQKSKP